MFSGRVKMKILYGLVIGILFTALFIIVLTPLTLWTGRTLDFWLSYWQHAPVHIPFWLDFVATLALNELAVALNVISEIVRLAIRK